MVVFLPRGETASEGMRRSGATGAAAIAGPSTGQKVVVPGVPQRLPRATSGFGAASLVRREAVQVRDEATQVAVGHKVGAAATALPKADQDAPRAATHEGAAICVGRGPALRGAREGVPGGVPRVTPVTEGARTGRKAASQRILVRRAATPGEACGGAVPLPGPCVAR